MKKTLTRTISFCLCLLTILYTTSCKKNDDHTHTFSELWTYDASSHWHGALCEHSEEVADKSEHTFNRIVIPPTFDSEGYTVYTCSVCGYEKQEAGESAAEHNFSTDWTYDSNTHWHACIDSGYEALKSGEEEHTLTEKVITPATSTSTGLGLYTCSVCGMSEERVIKISTSVVSVPSVEGNYYVGQPLSVVKLTGGKGSVDGSFAFTNPAEKIKQNGEYSVTFTPSNSDYASVECKVSFQATQLTLTVTAGANGSATPSGKVDVDYGSNVTVVFTPNFGYAVDSVSVDGVAVSASSKYTVENITTNRTLSVSFKESENKVEINCTEGTQGAYNISGSTVTFKGITQDSIYTISGEFIGNIVIDVGEAYKFELEMQGLRLSSDSESPIVILSGDKVTLAAKKDTDNFINDMRAAVDDNDSTKYSAAVYSLCDLDVEGKGSLTVYSENNNGIHTKDDLNVKNLTLTVNCEDNSLKGNDSVTIESGTLKLISRTGDTIKTTNSSVSEKGKQKGTVSVLGGKIDLYAACDGIDAAYDVIVDNADTVLNIYTDSFSEYSEDVSTKPENSSNERYIRFTSQSYTYSVKYYNSDSDFVWVNATYKTSVKGSRSTYYYYSFENKSGYDSVQIFIYSSTQTQGQDSEYLVSTDYITWNSAYDTFALKQSGSSLSYSWTNFTTSSSGGGMPGGMPGGPGGPGGMGEGNKDKLEYSAKGIKAANSITVNNGTLTIKAYDDAIHANSDTALENNTTPLGNVTIAGGTLNLYSNDDGIHADGTLLISNGKVTVENSYEGLEGTFVRISGGSVSVTSSDDGVNATTKSGEAIVISGGNVYVYAKGDGLDSNSTSSYAGILFSGGTTVVISNSNGNSSLDTERGYKYTGGAVLAIGSSGGMSNESTNCQNFSSIATKANLSLKSGQIVTVTVNESTVMSVTMPVNMSAMAVYLGSNSAKIS